MSDELWVMSDEHWVTKKMNPNNLLVYVRNTKISSIVFYDQRIYMSVFIYEAYVCSTSKSVVQECVLYK